MPPAAAPEGYHEALPGRLRTRLRGRSATPRTVRPWVLAVAAGLALAVLAPIVLQQQLLRARVAPAAPAAQGPVLAQPPVTLARAQEKLAAPAAQGAAAKDDRIAGYEDKAARPQMAAPAPRRESVAPAAPAAAPPPAKARDAFAAAPHDARANESDRVAETTSAVATGGLAAAPPPATAAAAAPLEARERQKEEGAGRAPAAAARADAPSSLKKTMAADLEEARKVLESWRRFVAAHPTGRQADEGRVRFVEAAVAVSRLTGAEADRALAEHEGRAYLAGPAPQAARVRAALRRLPGAP
jgi:hypothetical protein